MNDYHSMSDVIVRQGKSHDKNGNYFVCLSFNVYLQMRFCTEMKRTGSMHWSEKEHGALHTHNVDNTVIRTKPGYHQELLMKTIINQLVASS